MATRVRAIPGIKVDREQRQLWLGHLNQGTTSSYEIADSEYLREAAAATDQIIREIDRFSVRNLWPEKAGNAQVMRKSVSDDAPLEEGAPESPGV